MIQMKEFIKWVERPHTEDDMSDDEPEEQGVWSVFRWSWSPKCERAANWRGTYILCNVCGRILEKQLK